MADDNNEPEITDEIPNGDDAGGNDDGGDAGGNGDDDGDESDAGGNGDGGDAGEDDDGDDIDLDQFLEDCASTQIGSVTQKIRQHQAGDESVTDELWKDVIEQLRERAAEILANFPSVSREKEPDDLINDLFERLSRILAGEVINIKHRGDFYKSACRNFVWHLLDTLKKKSHSHNQGAQAYDPLAEESGPATKAERNDLYTLALEEVEKLPEHLREIFDLHFGGGLTFREIEEEIGVSKSEAQERWAEAKAVLRQKLQP